MCVEREDKERGKEMALETVVFPNDFFSYGCKDFYSLGSWNHDFGLKEEEESGYLDNHVFPTFSAEATTCSDNNNNNNSLPLPLPLPVPVPINEVQLPPPPPPPPAAAASSTSTATTRRKRRRTKVHKNKEEVENQRMTHIVVERNRRKQMNEYLAVLRSLMPASYVQRSDQASIIGGAINFVKELEQCLQSVEAEKQVKEESETTPFADFFLFPQYTSSSSSSTQKSKEADTPRTAIADIEVTMVESHANLKVLSKKRPKQILKMVVGFQNLHLTILHLNVTTVEETALYSFSVKVEDECKLKSVDEIASAVHEMLRKIEEETALSSKP